METKEKRRQGEENIQRIVSQFLTIDGIRCLITSCVQCHLLSEHNNRSKTSLSEESFGTVKRIRVFFYQVRRFCQALHPRVDPINKTGSTRKLGNHKTEEKGY